MEGFSFEDDKSYPLTYSNFVTLCVKHKLIDIEVVTYRGIKKTTTSRFFRELHVRQGDRGFYVGAEPWMSLDMINAVRDVVVAYIKARKEFVDALEVY